MAEPPSLVQPNSASWMWCWSGRHRSKLLWHLFVKGRSLAWRWAGGSRCHLIQHVLFVQLLQLMFQYVGWFVTLVVELKVKFCGESAFVWHGTSVYVD
jgi:hypothetical protein